MDIDDAIRLPAKQQQIHKDITNIQIKDINTKVNSNQKLHNGTVKILLIASNRFEILARNYRIYFVLNLNFRSDIQTKL